MKILVVSDSHGHTGYLLQAIEKTNPDHLIHLGDGFSDIRKITDLYPRLSVTQVAGNCDFFAHCANEKILTLEGVTFFLCHGHTRLVKQTLQNAYYAARQAQAQVLLFGHTHQPLHNKAGELTVLNPGSIGYDGRYGLIQITGSALRCDLYCI